VNYELCFPPQPGQLILCIDLSQISRSVSETLKILQELGYLPELRYRQQQKEIRLYALLWEKWFEPSEEYAEAEELEPELQRLAEALEPDDIAICCLRGLPARQIVTTAA
jgi:DNA invertase Pin-like site-specific DNA recombinase